MFVKDYIKTEKRLVARELIAGIADLFPRNSREMATPDPATLLTQIEERWSTKDEMEYRRLQFGGAKQMENENLWEFEYRLAFLQKRAKVDGDARFVETYKRGVLDDKLRETLMLRRPPITTRAELREIITIAQIAMLEHTREFTTPSTTIKAGLGTRLEGDLEARRGNKE